MILNNASDIQRGNVPTDSVYLGSELIWSRGSPPVPPPPPPSPYDRFPDNCVTAVRLDENGNETDDITYYYRTDYHTSEFYNLFLFLDRQESTARFNVYAGNDIGHLTDYDMSIGYEPHFAIALREKVKMFKYPSKWEIINVYEDLSYRGLSRSNYHVETVVLPTELAAVGSFSNMEQLRNIVFRQRQDGTYAATSIRMYAFYQCWRMQSVWFPSSITSIDSRAFYNCRELKTITIDKPSESISGAPWGATGANVIWEG